MGPGVDRYRGSLLGLAVGDAVGTTLEFQTPGSFEPITDMVGGGPFGRRPGEWTDDTSMALCLATSLTSCGGFDAVDQMNRYLRWWEEGYWSSVGHCFDIGATTRRALLRYKQTHDPFSGSTAPDSAGNGSLMRLCPVVLFFEADREAAFRYARESSRTTHGARECLDACELFAELLLRVLQGSTKKKALAPVEQRFESAAINRIAGGLYRTLPKQRIRGSGYVVDSLEAALWCFWHGESFADAVLLAANLGDDADTTAAICGQIAGAYYGEEGIPTAWLERLARVDEIRTIADSLARGAP